MVRLFFLLLTWCISPLTVSAQQTQVDIIQQHMRLHKQNVERYSDLGHGEEFQKEFTRTQGSRKSRNRVSTRENEDSYTVTVTLTAPAVAESVEAKINYQTLVIRGDLDQSFDQKSKIRSPTNFQFGLNAGQFEKRTTLPGPVKSDNPQISVLGDRVVVTVLKR